MKRISILALENCLASTIIGPMDIFSQAGMLWNQICEVNPTPYFEVEVVSLGDKEVTCLNGLKIVSTKNINEVEQTDLILISSGNIDQLGDYVKKAVPWLKKHYEKGATLASICTGAFLLAETGLLNNKLATTHWGYINLFRKKYIDVELKPERLIVDNGKLLCSGGVNSYAELCLFLVEQYCNYEIANQCSKSLVLGNRNESQNNYAIFEYQRKHNDCDILDAQSIIENEYATKINLDTIAAKLNMSTRNLVRRFKKATGDSPIEYMQRYRIEMAKRNLENTNSSIEEISFEVGYDNVKFFRSLFKRHTGITPFAYRNKYQASPI